MGSSMLSSAPTYWRHPRSSCAAAQWGQASPGNFLDRPARLMTCAVGCVLLDHGRRLEHPPAHHFALQPDQQVLDRRQLSISTPCTASSPPLPRPPIAQHKDTCMCAGRLWSQAMETDRGTTIPPPHEAHCTGPCSSTQLPQHQCIMNYPLARSVSTDTCMQQVIHACACWWAHTQMVTWHMHRWCTPITCSVPLADTPAARSVLQWAMTPAVC